MRRSWLSWLTLVGRRFFPWVVIDLPLAWLCYALALLVRGVTADLEYQPALLFGLLASLLVVACNETFGIYRRWWRYATSQDVVPLVVSIASATVLIVAADLAWPAARPMPLSVVFLGGFFALCAMTAVRYRTKPLAAIRGTWRRLVTPPGGGAATRVLVVGAGDAGQLLGWQLHHGPQAEGHHVVGFVDDDRRKQGMLIHGRKVLGDRSAIPQLVVAHEVDLIVIAIHSISGRDFRDIVGICQETTAQIKVLPNILGSIRGDGAPAGPALGAGPVAALDPARGDPHVAGPVAVGRAGPPSLFGDVTLEDLLGRHSVNIDRAQCEHLVRGKTVLVTGASGSIGSELCRQLADLRPRRLLMLDTNESGLHDLSIELQGYRSDDSALVPIVGDVTHEARMRAVFARERPAVVFHAAAYKHVPLMEEFPEEAVRVNVGGTRLLMELAAEYGSERLVLVSSDKAVEPSSVMGATKRICELLGATMPPGPTRFTAVRFGNVLGSRGSVVPTFSKQIDLGGPVTLTDPTMARYFMSVAEAASLIIQAANYTEGGDVFLLDMGEEINVADLARRMIRLRGLRPDVDIPIVVTGARPGEKLREILNSADERTAATPHPQVFRVEGGSLPCSPAELTRATAALLATAPDDRLGLRQRLWAIARDGVAPTPIPAPAMAGVGRREPGMGSRGVGVGDSQTEALVLSPRLHGATPRPLTADSRLPTPDPRPPIRVLAERAGGGLADAADRLLRLEPFYVIPAAIALLAYPNPLVGPALALVAIPWLLRWVRTGRPTTPTAFDVPLGLFLAGACVGLLVTTSGVWAGIRLTGLVAGLALLYLIVNHATTAGRLRAALLLTTGGTAVCCGLLVVLTAPYLPLDARSAWSGLIEATDGWRQAILGPDEALERFRFRASGVGALATFGLALATGPSLAGARRSTRLIGVGLVLLFGAAVVLSGSRGSLVSVAALAVALLGLRSGWFLAAVPIVLVGLWAALERGFFSLGAPDAQPLAVKVRFWQNAALMLHDYVLTGGGLGLRSVRDLYEAYFLPIGPTFSHAHNVFIQAYLEQGLLGCIGLVGLAATLFFYGRRAVAGARGPLAWGTALSAAGAATVLFFEGLTEVVILTSFGTVLLCVALGLLVAAANLDEGRGTTDDGRAARGEARAGESSPRPSPLVSRPSVVVGLFGLVAAALFLSPLGATVYLNLGAAERAGALLQDGVSRGDRERRLARAEALLRQGLEVDDRDPALWRNLAEIAIARGDGAEARGLLRRARERTLPADGYGLFQLGRLYREAGFVPEAVRAWREVQADDALLAWGAELRARRQWDRAEAVLLAAAELRPADPDVHRLYGQAARLARGGAEGAIGELERLAGLAPSSPWPHVELARLYDEVGRPADADAARRAATARGAR